MVLVYEAVEMSRILTIASHLFYSNRPAYSNYMMAIPAAIVQWEKEIRDDGTRWNDSESEIALKVAHMKAEITIAFQFPLSFIK